LFGGTHVVFVPEGRQISAYRAATGQKLWTSPRAESVLTTAPLLAGSFLWVGGKDGSLRGYNVSNGTLAARVPAGQFGIRSGIAFDRASDTAYLGNDGGQMLCFDARRRLIVARLEVGGEVLGGPVLGGGRVFFGTSQGTVLSVDASNILDRGFTFQADGAVRWPPLATDRKLYFGTDKGVFYCVDRGRGSPLWEYVTDERRPCIGQPILSGNRVYFVTADGTLYGFQEDR
ncbi:MAG: PQQ-binding-like beta-propeller repeat protein, partial [Planctomycetota bacterium]|nr:PQQ-binding-like beta-propeller repeat protein [Planctomycetota bacterium]